MTLSDAIEKLGRTIFEAPFNSSKLAEHAPELAEIRLAVIDAVKSKTHRVGAVRVFAFDLVRVHLRGVPDSQAEVLQSNFLAEYFGQDLRRALERYSCRFPEDLRVELRTSAQLPSVNEQWVWIETESSATAPVSQEAKSQPSVARLVVTKGVANEAELPLTKSRVNIGRSSDVYRDERPSRRNDLVFTEDNEINRTVSREHAHIALDRKSSEYRIYNDRWYKAGAKPDSSCGLWILRDGLSQPVHRNGRGVPLMPGDEIHLGRAVIKFVVG